MGNSCCSTASKGGASGIIRPHSPKKTLAQKSDAAAAAQRDHPPRKLQDVLLEQPEVTESVSSSTTTTDGEGVGAATTSRSSGSLGRMMEVLPSSGSGTSSSSNSSNSAPQPQPQLLSIQTTTTSTTFSSPTTTQHQHHHHSHTPTSRKSTSKHNGTSSSSSSCISSSLTVNGNTPKSRAYQARWDKQRSVMQILQQQQQQIAGSSTSIHSPTTTTTNTTPRSFSHRTITPRNSTGIPLSPHTTPRSTRGDAARLLLQPCHQVHLQKEKDPFVTTTNHVQAVALSIPPLSLGDYDQGSSRPLLAIATPDHVQISLLLPDDTLNHGPLLPHSKIRTLDWNRQSQSLALAGDEGVCYIYETDAALTTSTLQQLVHRIDRICALKFSHDGRYLAMGGFDGMLTILHCSNNNNDTQYQIIHEIPRPGLVLALDFSPDNRFLAVGGSDSLCTVLDAKSFAIVKEIPCQSSIHHLQWHPKGGRYLAIATKQQIYILDRNNHFAARKVIHLLSTMDEDTAAAQPTKKNHPSLCAWCPSGNYLAVRGSGGAVPNGNCVILETKSYTAVQTIETEGYTNALSWEQEVLFLSGGTPAGYLIVGDDSKVVVYRSSHPSRSDSSSMSVSGGASVCDSSVAGSSIMSGRSEWVFREGTFLDVDQDIQPKMDENLSAGSVTAVAFSKGSKRSHSTFALLGKSDGVLAVYGTHGWNMISTIQCQKAIACLCFSNGSRYFAAATIDSKIKIIATIPKLSVVAEVEVEASVSSMVFSRNNQKLALGCADGRVYLVSTDNWEITGSIDTMASSILAMDWTTKFLAVACDDGYVGVYDADAALRHNKATVKEFQFNAPVSALAIGNNSQLLAIGRRDGVLEVFVTRSGWTRCHVSSKTAATPLSPITSLDWFPNGSYLAVTNNNSTRVLDTSFWTEINRFETDTASHNMVASCSQNGQWFMATNEKGVVQVYDTSTWIPMNELL